MLENKPVKLVSELHVAQALGRAQRLANLGVMELNTVDMQAVVYLGRGDTVRSAKIGACK
jgi:hypothetical protein